MTATPAWPPKSLPRLFVGTDLSVGAAVDLDPAQANYLGNVLRREVGNPLLIFDGTSGEWLARIALAGKKHMTLAVVEQVRPAEILPDLILAFAPVKRAQTDWLVEKATELGIAALQPVMTRRTVAERVKRDRLRAIAIEAAEQCGRTVLPEIAEPVSLAKLLAGRDPGRTLYFADENGGAPVAAGMTPGAAMILIGPEGGWTDDERVLVRAAPHAVPISLGPRTLRAETAALAAVTAYMALAGDWRAS